MNFYQEVMKMDLKTLQFMRISQQLIMAVEDNNKSEVLRLIAQGADVNYEGGGHMTPIKQAMKCGNMEMVRLLESYGAENPWI